MTEEDVRFVKDEIGKQLGRKKEKGTREAFEQDARAHVQVLCKTTPFCEKELSNMGSLLQELY